MKNQTGKLSERARFYLLVRNFATRLAGALGAEIDSAVDDCLESMGEHLGVDRVALGGISKAGELMPALWVWGHGPPPKGSQAVDPSPGPEMVAQWNRDGFLVYNRLEDLDHLPQYQEHTRNMGIAAAVFWVYRDRGPWVEGMAISSPMNTHLVF